MIVDFFKWWYSHGWKSLATSLINKLRNMADYFSIGLLLRTLFAPFRQISAQEVARGGIMARIEVFFDKLLSRIIGAIVRIIILIAGIIALIIESILSIVLTIIWPFVPLLPAACVVLCVVGVSL